MKFPILVILLAASTFLQAQYPWPPEGEKGVDYYVNQRDKADGIHYRTYGDGTIFYAGEFQNGKPKPLSTLYYYSERGWVNTSHTFGETPDTVAAKNFYPSGNLLSEGTYIMQKKEGLWQFFDENGNILREENYINDQLEGQTTIFYASGQKLRTVSYADSLKQGPFQEYFLDGKAKVEGAFLDNDYHGTITYYFDNGKKLMEGEYVRGSKVGKWMEYNRNGSIRQSFIYENNVKVKSGYFNGEFEEYYANGIPQRFFSYKAGKLHGAYEEWYNKGEFVKEAIESNQTGPLEYKQTLVGSQIKMQGQYKDGVLFGDIEYFSEEGKRIKVETYENGKLVDTQNF